ncbi:MAG TPA: aminoglycoside 3'-phosphotransferase [Pseudonocardiaceae bacterium]
MIPNLPKADVTPPPAVVEVAAGRPVRPVWVNEVGGLTFQVGDGTARQFVKWTPPDSGIDHSAEAARLAWAGAFTPVPQVLGQGADDTGSWLITAGLPGHSAVFDPWKGDPATAVRAIGEGLRALHDTLPVGECPFSWSARQRLTSAHARAAAGRIDPRNWHPDHRELTTVELALDELADLPPTDELVVCHGDACAPNTLIGDDGRWCGHVDLGALGTADRWADLAIATWSTEWNYGPGWQAPLLDAYGIEADPRRIRYYRLLWDLG